MKIPYNCLHAHGRVLFSTRGGKIHTFSLPDGAHIATWKHPELETCTAAGSQADPAAGKEAEEAEVAIVADEVEQPPAKRQKVAEDDNAQQVKTDEDKASAKKGRRKEQRKPKPIPVPDRPVIIQLATTADGSHLVAVSAHDKAVWVFSHDGSGQLAQLSKRYASKLQKSPLLQPAPN